MSTIGLNDVVYFTVPVFSPICNLAFQLRREVFVAEQRVPENEEFDRIDLDSSHIVAVYDGRVIATMRLIWCEDYVQYSRFVVEKAYRGMGLGADFLRYALGMAEKRGYSKSYLEAQLDKTTFYEKLGFVSYGDTFLDGGMDHIRMRRGDWS